MRRWLCLAVVLLVAVFLAGVPVCFGQPKDGGTLTIGLPADFDKVDPHKGVAQIEGQTFSLCCENLVTSKKDFTPGPGLAESWDTSDDAKVWTFHLRKGVKFHNGREFKAKDVKWNFERMLEPKTASGMRVRLQNVESMDIVDDYTIKITLKNPQASFLAVMYGGSVQSPMVAPECVKEDGSITHPIGTGPFEFVSWEPHNFVKFKKFKDYWNKGLPHVDEIIVKMMPDVVARMTALKTGDVDIMSQLPIEQVLDLLKKKPEGFKVVAYSWTPSYFVFNTSKPPFNDVRVRQAVAYGMNKKDIEAAINHGYGQVINQPFHKESPWYCDIPDRTQDVAKAKQLLKEAGYPNGLEVSLTTQNKYLEYMMAPEILQAQVVDIGMKIKLDVVDFATYITKCRNKEHQMGSLGLAPVPDPDAYLPMALMKTGPYSGFSGNYDNPEVTRLLQEGSRALKFEDRKKMYCQAMKIIQEEVPYIYYMALAGVYGVRDRVKDFDPSMTFFFNYDGGGMQYLWLEK